MTLVPCAQDYLRQIPGNAVVQYLVYNEFEQRFSTSRSVDCKFERVLATIDTTDPTRSIFSAGVGGTVVARPECAPSAADCWALRPKACSAGPENAMSVSGGLRVPIKLVESNPVFGLFYLAGSDISDFQLHQQGDRSESDVIILP